MLEILTLILALFGIGISFYILYKKTTKKHVACPIGKQTCDDVINSKYSKTLGIENSLMGLLYYLFLFGMILVSYLGLQNIIFLTTNMILLLTSGFGLLFSTYLTYIQMFKLKNYCMWCLISASITLVIFGLELIIFT